jgi:hypothetical protein
VDEDCAGIGIEFKHVQESEDDEDAAEDAAHGPLDMMDAQCTYWFDTLRYSEEDG